jgi:hypothetical protein
MSERNESQSATEVRDREAELQTSATSQSYEEMTHEEIVGLVKNSHDALVEAKAAIEALVEENNALRAQAESGTFLTPGATVQVVVPPIPPKPTMRECVVMLENRIEEAMSTAGANKGRQIRPGPLVAMIGVLQEFRRNNPNTPQPDPFLDLA